MPHINALALSRILCKSLCSVWSFPDGDAHIQIYIYIYIHRYIYIYIYYKENLAPFISNFHTKILTHDGKLLHDNISSAQPRKLSTVRSSQVGKCFFFAGWFQVHRSKNKGLDRWQWVRFPISVRSSDVLPALVASGTGVTTKMLIKYNCTMPIE